jgi:hypothetical protein
MRGWGKVWTAAGVCVVLLWIVWPFYSVLALMSAVREKDAVRVEPKVDWPSLRQGLRDDLNALMLLQARRSSGGSGTDAMAAGILAALGPAMVNSMVDAYVTPSGLAALFAGEQPAAPSPGAAPATTQPVSEVLAAKDDLDIRRVKYAFFTGPLTFQVDMATDTPGEIVSAVFRWRGTWKLTRFVLPLDTLPPPGTLPPKSQVRAPMEPDSAP